MKGFLKFVSLAAAGVLVFIVAFEGISLFLETCGKKKVVFKSVYEND